MGMRLLTLTGLSLVGHLDLNKQHRYAVAIPTEEEAVRPIETYNTIKELEHAFLQMYQEACDMRGVAKPIPVDKVTRDNEWDGAQLRPLKTLIDKVEGNTYEAWPIVVDDFFLVVRRNSRKDGEYLVQNRNKSSFFISAEQLKEASEKSIPVAHSVIQGRFNDREYEEFFAENGVPNLDTIVATVRRAYHIEKSR